jgi:transposase
MKLVTRKRYTAEFKTQAVALVKMGKPVAEVSHELGIGSGVLYEWLRNTGPSMQVGDSAVGSTPGAQESEAQELRRLRREIADLKLENDILKKAAVILGTKPPHSGMR